MKDLTSLTVLGNSEFSIAGIFSLLGDIPCSLNCAQKTSVLAFDIDTSEGYELRLIRVVFSALYAVFRHAADDPFRTQSHHQRYLPPTYRNFLVNHKQLFGIFQALNSAQTSIACNEKGLGAWQK